MDIIDVETVFKNPVKRCDLPKVLGCSSDRKARQIMAELEKSYNIVNLQDGRGYVLADDETAVKYAMQERKRGIASLKKANLILSRCKPVFGMPERVVPVKAHFRRIGKVYTDRNQINLFEE